MLTRMRRSCSTVGGVAGDQDARKKPAEARYMTLESPGAGDRAVGRETRLDGFWA